MRILFNPQREVSFKPLGSSQLTSLAPPKSTKSNDNFIFILLNFFSYPLSVVFTNHRMRTLRAGLYVFI